MKTRILSAILLFSVLLIGNAKAENIDLLTAKQIGAYYFSVATGAKAPITADNLKPCMQFDNPTLCVPAMYAFNVAGDGFIIVSASDCTEPILAYSPVGQLDPENISPACQYMLDSYAALISDNQNNNAQPSAEVQALWQPLRDRTFTCDPASKAVLVQSKWNQDAPYNLWCPTKNGTRCPAGCVATAMGQIIHFWKFPEVGGEVEPTASFSWNGQTIRYKFRVDSNRFDFANMPNTITYNSSYERKRAIGKLLFACGVTVKMSWDPDGSGAYSPDVPVAFYKYFNYNSAATYIQRRDYSNKQWLDILHDELDNHRRPVYYSASDPSGTGRDAAGHAFVIAGSSSDNETKFYIRWGWGGRSDGFFTLSPASSIESAGGYTFSSGHGMVYRIYPNTLGINDNTAYTEAPCYPNPASDYLMIPSDLPLNAALTIYSVDGKIVDNLIIPGGTKEYRLNLQGYAPGLYIYRLNGNAVKFTVK